ncbi:MAG: 6-phosphogluconolactonase [Candidatus Omnitrophota bacterium]
MAKFRKIHIFQTEDYVSYFAAQLWFEIAQEAVSERGIFTVALSGGSTPVEFYRKLSMEKDRFPWDKTHVFLVDERFVPFDKEDSNYGMIRKNLLEPAGIKVDNVHFLREWDEDIELSADKYEGIMKGFFGSKGSDFPRFDLIVLGVGEDGHVASLFPGDPALAEDKKLAVSVKNDSARHERISITFPVINSARYIVFLATGAKKAKVMKEVLEEENPDLPATRVDLPDGKVFVLLDNNSGALLNI